MQVMAAAAYPALVPNTQLAEDLWRMTVAWWLFLVIGIPAATYLSAFMHVTLNDRLPFSPWYAALPAVATTLFIGPVE